MAISKVFEFIFWDSHRVWLMGTERGYARDLAAQTVKMSPVSNFFPARQFLTSASPRESLLRKASHVMPSKFAASFGAMPPEYIISIACRYSSLSVSTQSRRACNNSAIGRTDLCRRWTSRPRHLDHRVRTSWISCVAGCFAYVQSGMPGPRT